MASLDDLSEKIASITLEHELHDDKSHAINYYETRKTSQIVNFARLEKGLLLFIYVHETTKDTLHVETALWDRRVCVNIIRDGDCSKPRDQCRREHDSPYRQPNLCSFWYIQSCRHQSNCRYAHSFSSLAQHHHYILTDTDNRICKLIRFVRNFAGHYIDSAIKDANDVQELHKEIVVLMVHLVHALSRKRVDLIDHLNLFLEATTIKQLIPQGPLLRELDKTYAVPEVFLQSNVNFTSHWYKHETSKRPVDFNQVSPKFLAYFNGVFVSFYDGRLRSRGAPAAWD